MNNGCIECGWFYLDLCETYEDGSCRRDRNRVVEDEKMATYDCEQARRMLGVGNGSRARRMSGAEFMDEVQELWGTNGNTVYVIVDGKRYFVKDVRSDEENNIVLEAGE